MRKNNRRSVLAVIFLGIYLPVQYKLGYEKTKFAFMVVIMATPLLLPYLLELKRGALFNLFQGGSQGVLYSGVTLLAVMVLILSVLASIHIFKRTEFV